VDNGARAVIHRLAVETAEFVRRLEEAGGYTTPPDAPRSRADRLLGRFDWWYHLRNVVTFAAAGRCARRGGYDSRRFQADSCRMLRNVEACGGRVSIAGMERLREMSRPAVFVSNHMSLIETTVLPLLLLSRGPYVTVVKEELLRFPAMGAVLKAVGVIAVTRSDPREDLRRVLAAGEAALRDGVSILLFPQARRGAVLRMADFNSLGAKLAKRGGALLAPVAVKTDFLGIRLGPFRDFGPVDRNKTVHIEFGPPVRMEGGERAAHRQTLDFIAERLRAWGGEVE